MSATPEAVTKLSRDLRAAEILIKADGTLEPSAAYLAHRAIGMLFKAWLLENDGEFKDKYELHKLYSRVQERANAPQLSAVEIDALVQLGRFGGLPCRQPGDEDDGPEALDWTRVRALFQTLARGLPSAARSAAA